MTFSLPQLTFIPPQLTFVPPQLTPPHPEHFRWTLTPPLNQRDHRPELLTFSCSFNQILKARLWPPQPGWRPAVVLLSSGSDGSDGGSASVRLIYLYFPTCFTSFALAFVLQTLAHVLLASTLITRSCSSSCLRSPPGHVQMESEPGPVGSWTSDRPVRRTGPDLLLLQPSCSDVPTCSFVSLGLFGRAVKQEQTSGFQHSCCVYSPRCHKSPQNHTRLHPNVALVLLGDVG